MVTNYLFVKKMLVFGLQAYIIAKLSQKRLELKSLKNAPLGNIGKKFMIR